MGQLDYHAVRPGRPPRDEPPHGARGRTRAGPRRDHAVGTAGVLPRRRACVQAPVAARFNFARSQYCTQRRRCAHSPRR
eukprot:2867352-Heterocapsa_arctica.AAC.1